MHKWTPSAIQARLNKSPTVKLNPEIVRLIRKESLSIPAITRLFNISQTTAYMAKTGRTWRHVK